jgi:hypothetical protein
MQQQHGYGHRPGLLTHTFAHHVRTAAVRLRRVPLLCSLLPGHLHFELLLSSSTAAEQLLCSVLTTATRVLALPKRHEAEFMTLILLTGVPESLCITAEHQTTIGKAR